jgi:hypothetical protein
VQVGRPEQIETRGEGIGGGAERVLPVDEKRGQVMREMKRDRDRQDGVDESAERRPDPTGSPG